MTGSNRVICDNVLPCKFDNSIVALPNGFLKVIETGNHISAFTHSLAIENLSLENSSAGFALFEIDFLPGYNM